MSINPTQRRLDAHLINAQQKLDDIALNVADSGASQADSYAFFEASMNYSNASWAVGQLLSVKHGLAKAIINDFN
ncbi:serine kinase [Brenneria roseae subsp. americana]|uniref:Serine kinase n=1 Tax=Brenneria roseae subsp. americana TaxID=1508507 RepID=A0A2U1TTQ7_9GAMM|nr:serine kinase [Brenneria roseae]PWC12798.1 serine kinase [Brenneria roseae subsp. americana]